MMSVGLTVAAATRMRTSPGPGCGSGSSETSSTSGPPNREKVTARMSLVEQRQLDGVSHRSVAQVARVEVVAAIVDWQHPGPMVGVAPRPVGIDDRLRSVRP